MKRIFVYLVLFVSLFIALPAMAQDDFVIRGTVMDEFDKPIAGATVRAGGIDKAVITDKNGNYSIIVPKDAEIIVSCVGYKTAVTKGGALRLKVLQTNVKEVVAVSKKKKQDIGKVKMIDPKAIVVAVDTLLKRMPTSPAAGAYDTAVVHAYIKREVYDKFNKNPEVMTGVANAYYTYVGEKKNWVFNGVTYPDTFWITNRFCADSLYSYRYIDYAIAADSTYGPAYELAGNIHRDEGRYLEAMKWYRRGIKNAPQSANCYQALAKLVIGNDTTTALNTMRALAQKDTISPVNLLLGRMYYDLDELGRAHDYFRSAFWSDSLKREKFTENDLLTYLASGQMTYNLTYGKTISSWKIGAKRDSLQLAILENANKLSNEYLTVSLYGLERYPDSEGLIRQAFYLSQRLEVNDTAMYFAKKLFAMPDVKLITDDYLTYAKLYAALGDLPSADEKYNQAFDMCLNQMDETRKEADVTESAIKVKRLTRQLENLKTNEDIIVKEHTRLYVDNYDRKISIANFYIDKKKSFGRNDYVEELNQLGAALAVKAEAVDTTKMVSLWKQVDAVYEEMAQVSPNDAPLALYYRLLCMQKIDELTKEKTGVEFCEGIIAANDIYTPMVTMTRNNVITAHEYLIYYYYDLWRNSNTVKKKRNKKYHASLEKLSGDLMVVDPNNNLAMQITTLIY